MGSILVRPLHGNHTVRTSLFGLVDSDPAWLLNGFKAPPGTSRGEKPLDGSNSKQISLC